MSVGVTSTHSSSRMYSRAWSSESVRGGMSRTVESADAARVFVSFFSFVAFTSRSSTRYLPALGGWMTANDRWIQVGLGLGFGILVIAKGVGA